MGEKRISPPRKDKEYSRTTCGKCCGTGISFDFVDLPWPLNNDFYLNQCGKCEGKKYFFAAAKSKKINHMDVK